MRKPRYVIVTRDVSQNMVYAIWGERETIKLEHEIWLRANSDGSRFICGAKFRRYTGLYLRKGMKRRAKITYFKGGGCSWRWAGK